MKQKQFLEFTVNQSQSIYDLSNQHRSLLQQCIKQLDQLVQSADMFKNQFEKDLGSINKQYQISELENIIQIVNNEFLLLQMQQIDLIINLKNNQSQCDFTFSQDLLKQAIIQVQKLQLLITVDNIQSVQEQQQFQQQQTAIEEKIQSQFVQSKGLQSRTNEKQQIYKQQGKIEEQIKQENGQIKVQQVQKLESQQISYAKEKEKEEMQQAYRKVVQNNQKIYSDYFDFQSDGFIKVAQISEDEKYLAIGNKDCKLFLYDMNTKKQVKQLDFNQYVNICRFTKDSRYLICGDAKGYLYYYDFKNNVSQLYNNQIHKEQINDILVINNNQIITCSFDQSIIITNIPILQNNLPHQNSQTNQALLIQHNHYFNGIDFDFDNDLIISCSSDGYISFFMKQNGIEIFEQQVHSENQIHQIQIMPNNKILSSDIWSLMLWQIDYELKLLKNIRQFKQINNNFTFVDNSRIVIVRKGQVCICDDDLNLLYSQKDYSLSNKYCINNILKFGLLQNKIDKFKQLHYYSDLGRHQSHQAELKSIFS
ncbi:hypothetical protein pb186bvf_018532 [Paramecium bursaria]